MIKRLFLKSANRYTSRWLVISIDVLLVSLTFILAYLIRFNFSLKFEFEKFIFQIPLIILVSLFSFIIVGSYKGVVRHTGQKDAINVFLSASLMTALLIVIMVLNRFFKFNGAFSIPLSIIVIHYLLNAIILIASRVAFKIFYHRLISNIKSCTKVIIYGAGDSGFITHSALMKDTLNNYDVIGFIDDNPSKIGKTIDRVRVYSPEILMQDFIQKNGLKEVIVSIQNISPTRLMEITDSLLKHNVKIKIVPAVNTWIDGKLNVGQIKQVKIEDLLERAPIKINNPVIKNNLKNKVVFVTGAAGSIGSEIARQVSLCDITKLVLVDQAESQLYNLQQEFVQNKKNNIYYEVADIVDKKRVDELFNLYSPQIIFHAAAYKHVPLMEGSPYEAIKVNVIGTRLLSDLAIIHHVEKFVMVSTDKAVNPTNVMGATKRVAEMYTSCLYNNSKTKFITTRFGNVLGSNGSVVPLFTKQIESGGPITVTHRDITRFFMTIPEACQLVLEAGVMGNGGEVYVFDMGESVNIYDIAIKMIQLSGFKFPDDIDIEITGLRPGEKLYEELLANNENTLPTYHDKIMIAQMPEMKVKNVKSKIDALSHSIKKLDSNNLVLILKELVPEYKSNNSIYEKLDE